MLSMDIMKIRVEEQSQEQSYAESERVANAQETQTTPLLTETKMSYLFQKTTDNMYGGTTHYSNARNPSHMRTEIHKLSPQSPPPVLDKQQLQQTHSMELRQRQMQGS